MAETKQILRIFQLIRSLSQPPLLSKKQLAERYSVNIRTIERDFELLEDLGYFVDFDKDNRYFIQVEAYPAEKGCSLPSKKPTCSKPCSKANANTPCATAWCASSSFTPS
ncbi:MAG: hypothetical protein OHK0053_38580 [Microscillaceae bacterium]